MLFLSIYYEEQNTSYKNYRRNNGNEQTLLYIDTCYHSEPQKERCEQSFVNNNGCQIFKT